MPFTEFACRSGGSNLNAGSRSGNSTEPGTAADITYASGSWVAATRTFTPAGGANPTTDGVAVGDFVSIYPDGSTVTPYVARITTVGSTTFEVSATVKAGTAPADGVTNTSAKIGGAWKGPNGSDGWPLNNTSLTALNVSGNDGVRINFKNDATYNITASLTASVLGVIQGYASSYGDGGRAIIDGGTSGTSYILLTLSACKLLKDFVFQNNGATGSASGLSIGNGSGSEIINVAVHDVRGTGFSDGAMGHNYSECVAYNCNQSNTGNLAGFSTTLPSSFLRCIAHNNSGSNTCGFYCVGNSAGAKLIKCIADSNGAAGIEIQSRDYSISIVDCEVYDNGGNGILITAGTTSTTANIENCNLIKNAAYGIAGTVSTGSIWGRMTNCAFGSGTQANTSGTTNGLMGMQISGTVTYAADVTPWVDPANGDFRISLIAAKNVGRGDFLQTQAGYTGTVGYPDRGAAQHQETAGTTPIGRFVNVPSIGTH